MQLDICDMRQPFGLSGLQFAMESEKLLSALMRLSKACMIQRASERKSLAESIDPLADTSLCGDSTENLLYCVFDNARQLVSNIPRAGISSGHSDFIHSLVHYAYDEDIKSAMYWLSLRLGKCSAEQNGLC